MIVHFVVSHPILRNVELYELSKVVTFIHMYALVSTHAACKTKADITEDYILEITGNY